MSMHRLLRFYEESGWKNPNAMSVWGIPRWLPRRLRLWQRNYACADDGEGTVLMGFACCRDRYEEPKAFRFQWAPSLRKRANFQRLAAGVESARSAAVSCSRHSGGAIRMLVDRFSHTVDGLTANSRGVIAVLQTSHYEMRKESISRNRVRYWGWHP